MAKKTVFARWQTKAITSGKATIPASNDHTDGTWLPSDLYKREILYSEELKCLYYRTEITDEIVPIASNTIWNQTSEGDFTPAPSGSFEIETVLDFTGVIEPGDVIAVKTTGCDLQFNYVESVSDTSIVLFSGGVPLEADIEYFKFSKANKSRIAWVVLFVSNQEFWDFGASRPQIRATPGAALTTPSNLFGENVFWGEKLEIPHGSYLVRSKVSVEDLGSSATNGAFSVGFSGSSVCSIDLLEAENYPTETDRDTYQVSTPNQLNLCNVTAAGGNKDISGVTVQLWFFTNADL